MTPLPSFLDALKLAAAEAERAEETFRRKLAEQTRALEQVRVFAYRRLNLMRPIAEAVADVETEEAAVVAARAVLCSRLGWATESEVRSEVLARFEPVMRQVFASLARPADEGAAGVVGALNEFEAWYAQTHPNSFWVLFEVYLPETPRVDF
jgi:hypothetical protein